MQLITYTTPASVDTFGSYPGAQPGDVFESMYNGRVFRATVCASPAHSTPYGAVLRQFEFQQVEGPLTRFASYP